MNFPSFLHSLLPGLSAAGRYRKSRAYVSLLSSLSGFSPGLSGLSLDTVFSPGFLRGYQRCLLDAGHSRNTIAFYLSTLRSAYGLAVEAGYLAPVGGLFDNLLTGTAPTEKRALATGVIARLMTANLSGKPRLEACRDYFVLSLYLQGITFVDLAHLHRSDLQGDRIRYCRRKTGTPVEVSVIPAAMPILKKLMASSSLSGSPYLLPILTLSDEKGRYKEYQSALHRQNRQLKELAAYLGIEENLTTYTVRHSWATIAYHNGVEVGVVSQGMGHHTEEITRIYLSSFGADRLTHANMVVLHALLKPVLEGQAGNVSPAILEDVKKQMKEVKDYLNGTGHAKSRIKSPPGGKGRAGWGRNAPGLGRNEKCPSLRK